MDLNQISRQAFLEELANWELALQRDNKKLKQLKKNTKHKLQLNTIEITLIAIENQLIKYRKAKERKTIDSATIIEEYTSLSKGFMSIMEKIGEALDEEKYRQNYAFESYSQQNQQPNKTKSYLAQTFAFKMTKQPTRSHKSKSFMQNQQQSSIRQKSRKQFIKNKARPNTSLRQLQMEEQEDLADIRYQLKEIKSMMMQIENEIKFHTHQDLDREIGRIASSNKRLSGEVRALREDNQFILGRVQGLKDQIVQERKAQSEMIRQFEIGRQGRGSVSELAHSHYNGEEVSEWVKVRI